MTVIAYRDGVMAADSAVFAGDRYAGTVRKIVRASDGGLAAASGPHAECHRFREWIASGGSPGEFVPHECGEGGFGALIVRTDGTVWRMDAHGVIYPAPAAAYHLEGSGEDIAAGALEANATAKEAVEVVCRAWAVCRPPIQIERLHPETAPPVRASLAATLFAEAHGVTPERAVHQLAMLRAADLPDPMGHKAAFWERLASAAQRGQEAA